MNTVKETKTDAFVEEANLLESAKQFRVAEVNSLEEYQVAFDNLYDGYAKLLKEARFLTKVSDRLEKKLSKANAQLEKHNVQITKEKEQVSRENVAVKAQSKKIIAEHKRLGKKFNKFQIAVAIIVFMAFLLVLGFLYILFGDGTNPGLLNS